MTQLLEGSARVESLPTQPAAGAPLRSRQFFLAIALVLSAMVVRGFWPSYFGQLGAPRPWVMHLHGVVYTGWMVLFLLQVSLIYGRRVRTHRTIGNRVGIAYGALVWVLGLVVSFAAPVLHVRAAEWTVDRAAGFMIFPLGDMVLFAGFFGAAIAYKAKPEFHKRLMLVATIAVVFAAVARMGFTPPVLLLVWLSPLLAAMAFDWITRRQVHRAYLVSLPILVVAFTRIFLELSEVWLPVGRALLAPFL